MAAIKVSTRNKANNETNMPRFPSELFRWHFCLRLMKATTKTSKPPKKDEIAQKDNRNQERSVHFLYFIEKKVKFYFVECFYSTLF